MYFSKDNGNVLIQRLTIYCTAVWGGFYSAGKFPKHVVNSELIAAFCWFKSTLISRSSIESFVAETFLYAVFLSCKWWKGVFQFFGVTSKNMPFSIGLVCLFFFLLSFSKGLFDWLLFWIRFHTSFYDLPKIPCLKNKTYPSCLHLCIIIKYFITESAKSQVLVEWHNWQIIRSKYKNAC